jgi:hypothetical protein
VKSKTTIERDVASFTDPSAGPPIKWHEALVGPVDSARLRQLAAELRPSRVLTDREVIVIVTRRLLEADPDVTATDLVAACSDALATTAVVRYLPDILEGLAWRSEGGTRAWPSGSEPSADAPSAALNARIERLLAKEQERRAGRRFGSA